MKYIDPIPARISCLDDDLNDGPQFLDRPCSVPDHFTSLMVQSQRRGTSPQDGCDHFFKHCTSQDRAVRRKYGLQSFLTSSWPIGRYRCFSARPNLFRRGTTRDRPDARHHDCSCSSQRPSTIYLALSAPRDGRRSWADIMRRYPCLQSSTRSTVLHPRPRIACRRDSRHPSA